MNQSFTSKQLYKICKQTEIKDCGLTDDELEHLLKATSDQILDNTFNFNILQLDDYYIANDFANKLVLRKLNDNIKRIYKDQQANRRIIIFQIKTLLEETCPYWVLKMDIKGFYENIDRTRIIERFQNDLLLSYHSRQLIKKLFESPALTSVMGVPRGINISATLSEFYMRKFDRWIRRYEGVYYYARFVDDIFIFTYSKKAIIGLQEVFDAKLSELASGLISNKNKIEVFDNSFNNESRFIDYLGYRFTLDKTSKNPLLRVSIAEKKIKKIKSRIILSLLDFIKNKNFALLENRIKFLTGNYSIRKFVMENELKSGVYYNYLHVTDYKVFDSLNIFWRRALFSKNKRFGLKLSRALSLPNRDKLNKYCFRTGFDQRLYYPFSYEEMCDITKCWK